MGALVDGKWHEKWDYSDDEGKFERDESKFRNWVTQDGNPGPTGEGGFKAEPNRYHLYVSYACPWASRALIMRKLKGLEEMISLSVVNPLMLENGWTFKPDEGVIQDPILHADYLHQIYTHDSPDYTGRVTVPVLYDKKQDRIVNNESSEIIRMLNSAFDEIGATEGNYIPDDKISEIDDWNNRTYEAINNGVYKAGFATKQEVYEKEVTQLFEELDFIESHLENHPFLVGEQPTEADWRLFPTLVRFDCVYFGHFKCNIRQLKDYKNLWHYTRKLYNWPGVAETVNFKHIKEHYYRSHKNINPTGIVPTGPKLDFSLE